MINQLKIGLPQYNTFAKCPAAVTSGMLVLIGQLAGVAMDDYQAALGGTTFCMDGEYALTVIGQSQLSPNSGLQVNQGDELFAAGTFDAATNCTYNLTIDKTNGNTPIGNYIGTSPILSGVTNTAAPVRLKVGGSGPYTP